jgi:protein SCO1/2
MQTFPRRAVLLGLAAGAAALAGGMQVTAHANSLHGARPTGVELAPLFRLTTHRGEILSRSFVKGRPFIVLFGYTNCPEVCPTALNDLSMHLASLGDDANRIAVLFVTVDPERDTPEHLSTYLQSFDSRIVGLGGTVDQVTAVAEAFGAPFRRGATASAGSYNMDHSYMVFMMDRYGLLARAIGYNEPPQRMADVSKRLLAQ